MPNHFLTWLHRRRYRRWARDEKIRYWLRKNDIRRGMSNEEFELIRKYV